MCKHACGTRFLSMTSHLFDAVWGFLKAAVGCIISCCAIMVLLCASQKPKAFSASLLSPLFFTFLTLFYPPFLYPLISLFLFKHALLLFLSSAPILYPSPSLSVFLSHQSVCPDFRFEAPNLVCLAHR